jgi:5-methylcytosine-specific restriction endonuclease McrA
MLGIKEDMKNYIYLFLENYINKISIKYNIEKKELLKLLYENEVPIYKKQSTNSNNLIKWIKNGNKIPICINNGCFKNVSIRHWTSQGDPSLKTECSRCSSARIKNKNIYGIIFHKKNYCENKDGILGFFCPIDYKRYNEFPSDIYHMDHTDGNHMNNSLENVKTFCSICHTCKGKNNGDFNAFKSSSRFYKI